MSCIPLVLPILFECLLLHILIVFMFPLMLVMSSDCVVLLNYIMSSCLYTPVTVGCLFSHFHTFLKMLCLRILQKNGINIDHEELVSQE